MHPVLLELFITVLIILLIVTAILLLNVVADYSENLASAFSQLFYDFDGLPVMDLIIRNDQDRSIAFGGYNGSVNNAAKRWDIDQHISELGVRSKRRGLPLFRGR